MLTIKQEHKILLNYKKYRKIQLLLPQNIKNKTNKQKNIHKKHIQTNLCRQWHHQSHHTLQVKKIFTEKRKTNQYKEQSKKKSYTTRVIKPPKKMLSLNIV